MCDAPSPGSAQPNHARTQRLPLATITLSSRDNNNIQCHPSHGMEAARVVEGGRHLSAVASQLWDYRTSRTYTDLVLQSAEVGLQTKVGEDFTITGKASIQLVNARLA